MDQSRGGAQPVKTVVWTVLGFSLMVLAASVDYHWLRTFSIPIYLFTLGLLSSTSWPGR